MVEVPTTTAEADASFVTAALRSTGVITSATTVAEVKEGSETWNRPMLEAALEYEQAHAQRKGAIAAIEAALAQKDEADKEED